MGNLLMAVGAFLLILGILLNYAPWLVSWFGRLPLDIHIQDEHKIVFIPITSMFILSLILSLMASIFFRR